MKLLRMGLVWAFVSMLFYGTKVFFEVTENNYFLVPRVAWGVWNAASSALPYFGVSLITAHWQQVASDVVMPLARNAEGEDKLAKRCQSVGALSPHFARFFGMFMFLLVAVNHALITITSLSADLRLGLYHVGTPILMTVWASALSKLLRDSSKYVIEATKYVEQHKKSQSTSHGNNSAISKKLLIVAVVLLLLSSAWILTVLFHLNDVHSVTGVAGYVSLVTRPLSFPALTAVYRMRGTPRVSPA